MNEIIIFSQAPADIQYVLFLYKINISEHKINIFVVNVYNNYKYLNSLKLNAEISFIPLIGQKKTIQFIEHVLNLKSLYRKTFKHSSNNKVYFFSLNYDYVTAFFVNKLSLNNNVHFCDIYSINGPEINNIFLSIKKILCEYLLGFNIKFFMNGSTLTYQYVFKNTNIKVSNIEIKKSLIDCYKFKISIKSKSNKKSVLLFESNGMVENYFVKYENDLKELIISLISEYKVYIKPHPRVGYSKILNDYDLKIIEDYIPSELLSYNDFSILLGIESTAIATVLHPNKFSLIDIFEFKKPEVKENFRSYLNNLSKSELKYINSIEDLKQ